MIFLDSCSSFCALSLLLSILLGLSCLFALVSSLPNLVISPFAAEAGPGVVEAEDIVGVTSFGGLFFSALFLGMGVIFSDFVSKSFAAFITSLTFSSEPILPGLVLKHAAPALAASIALK